jgi:hypothetical protein
MRLDWIRKKLRGASVPPLGQRHTLCNWVREGDETSAESAPLIDMVRYGELISVLPDRIVENLERARLARDGRMPMLKAGLGYEELLSSIIVDGTAIASSSAEARLAPALLIPANYLAPGGIPGRTLRFHMRGRGTTLATAATMTLRQRIATTDIITGTTVQATGAVAAHATGQTNSQWEWQGHVVVRSVGTAGTVFGQGRAELAWQDLTTASQSNLFSGSAGATAPSTATYDTTVAQFLEMTGQWSLTTAYSIQAHTYLLEATN